MGKSSRWKNNLVELGRNIDYGQQDAKIITFRILTSFELLFRYMHTQEISPGELTTPTSYGFPNFMMHATNF